MARCTRLQMLTEEELLALAKKPASVNAMDKPARESFSTYHLTALNYFLTGSAFPSKKKPLGAALLGEKQVATKALEDGSFSLLSVATTAKLAVALAAVDRKALRAAVKAADLEALREEEEVDEEYALEESGDAAGELTREVAALAKFYAAAAKKKRGVLLYTT